MPRTRADTPIPLEQRIGAALLRGREDEGVLVVENGEISAFTPLAGDLLGCDPQANVGRSFDDFLGVLEGDVLQLQLQRLLADEEAVEFIAPRPGAADEWIEARRLTLSPGVAFVIRDVTARELSDRTLRLLLHELNHRVKNMLATVQSMARQSLRGERAAASADDFEDRLMALAWTYDLLTREKWAGARLRELVDRTLSPHVAAGSPRLAAEGPDLWLQPRQALSVALALHELATNAVKYGALSMEAGRIAVSWRVAEQASAADLEIEWLERGGPPVSMPSRRGFGSRLIERNLARDLGGEVALAFEPGGVRCRIKAPLNESNGT